MTERIFNGDTAEGFEAWRAYAVDECGMTPQAAYQSWRKAWWEIHAGRSWRYRRRGIKGKRRHYADASTATEEIAT